ncbi:MAG TPA: DUF885 family protein [Pyrinomonadaceae bacterium]|nr:DUF885 family protein [Pyrinomonadaceae bacterium]
MRIELPKNLRRARARATTAAACCLLAALQLAATGLDTNAQRRRRRAPAPAAPVLQDARVAQIAEEYLRGHYAFNPTEGTAAGLHEYDAALESRGREAVAAEARRLRGVIAALARVNESRLSPESRYDFLWLASHARARLLELEDVRMWQRDPGIYSRLVAASFDNVLKRDYAPVERRLDALLARARQAARLLAEGRANLENPPRVYTETAVGQVAGSIDFFSRAVPQMFERAGGGRLSAARRSEFAAAVESVTSALRSYSDWLQRDLLPRSNGDFAIGAENFRKKLLYEEMIDAPLPALLREGERELRRTQEEMRRVAEEIAPDRDLSETLRAVGREHPSSEGLVGETRAELGRIRAFVRERGILTPPAEENLIVAETPTFRRLGFASMDAPGPFERAAAESYYYVTPPDPAWDARRREEHLSFFNRSALPIVSIHEAFPGHYYQLLAARRAPSRVRAAFGSASFVEGWAHYCEQMMLDEGFGGGSPKLRLAQLHAALTRLCRYLVGIRMHAEGMTYEQGVDFFRREGYMERANAEREALRGTLDPTYLVYTLGKMEILKLREDYRRARGEGFRLGEFHDRLLSHGMPPVKIVRLALLGDAAGPGRDLAGAGGREAADDRTNVVEFSVVASGAYSAYEGGRRVEIISNEEDWRQVWRAIGGGRPAPEVNFTTRAVIVVYQGQKPTGGYGVSVEEIRRDGTVLAVRVNERRPASDSVTTQVITSPFVAVSVPRPATGTIVRFADETGAGRGIEPGPQKSQKNVTPPARRRPQRRRGRPGRSL